MAENDAEQPAKNITIQKVYVKDSSFESPNTPEVFAGQWSPQTQLNLRSSHRVIADDVHEVVLTLTVEAKQDEKSVFLVELHQAGLFEISGLEEQEREVALGSFCPNILYPYAREGISSAVQRGGFPEFILQPIDFDGLYAQAKRDREAKAATASTNGNGELGG